MSEASDTARRRALARDADEETRYRAVAALEPGRPEERGLLLEALADTSWRVRSAAVERLATAAEALPALVDTLAAGPGVGAREAAGAALARIGAPAVPALVERLGAADPDLQQAVASVLAQIADARAVPALTARLADPDPNVRGAAAEALAKIGGRDALDALRAAAESDDPTLRLSAVEGLVQLRACVSPAVLERLLADRTLRRPAYRLLGACDDPAAFPLIGRGLCETARSAREGALAALGQQRARRPLEAIAPLLRDAAAAAERDPALADAWAAALASHDPLVAQGAVTALAAAGASRHVAAMLRLAEDERLRPLVEDALEALPPDAGLREALAAALPSLGQLARLAALAALARGGSPAAFESLVREASDPDTYGQAEAIAALGRVGDARGVGPLAGLLADDAPAAAGLASTALVHLARRDAAARAAVLAALRDRAAASPSVALYRTLGATGDLADLALLRAGLRADAAAHRAAAAGALGGLAGRGHVEAGVVSELAGASRDHAWQVRSAAARALAAAGAGGSDAVRAEAHAALRAALRDAEPMVRAAAAEALGACGDGEDAGALADLAREAGATAPLVIAALRALAALGPVPLDVVLRAVSHPDPEVVKEGVHAAARLAAPDAVAILLETAASPRWDVRQAAARAMRASGAAALAAEAARLAASEADPLVAQAFAEAARALGAR